MSQVAAVRSWARRARNWRILPLLIGFVVLAVPTAIGFSGREWDRDYGAHEPIILMISGVLILRRRPEVREIASPGSPVATWLVAFPSLLLWVFGHAYDFPTLEMIGLIGVGLALLIARWGPKALQPLWFPLSFLLFAIPLPHAVLDHLTQPLKQLVSSLATDGSRMAGLPVSQQGVIIFIGQYELLVEDACSGLNSLTGLSALSLLYGYLRRGASLTWSSLMLIMAVPLAIAANVLRVGLLVLLTYRYGDVVGQSFLHFAASGVLFLTALALLFAFDAVAYPLLTRLRPS